MSIVVKNITDFTEKGEDTCNFCGSTDAKLYAAGVVVNETLDPYKNGISITFCSKCAEAIGMFIIAE